MLSKLLSSPSKRILRAPLVATSRFSTCENFEFKSDTKQLLNLMAKSLYVDKEVFVRELISNASDACEKLRFFQASNQVGNLINPELDLGIAITCDENARILTIEDTGIGMSKEDLINNLGVIAKSGTKAFVEANAQGQTATIGQFGVGFYSVFVVADEVSVYSKAADGGSAVYKWTSKGDGNFSIETLPADTLERGTRIVISIKEECKEFVDRVNMEKLAQKFSNFVSFPIKIWKEVTPPKKEAPKEGEEAAAEEAEAGPTHQFETLKKSEALWTRNSATEAEHLEFFRYIQGTSYGKPMYSLLYKADAPLSIQSALYIPEDAPSRMFTKEPEVGVALYSRKVLIQKHADKLVPKWLHWVKGVIDCEDIEMNVSRERVQDSRLIEKLSHVIVKRILKLFKDESKRDPAKYNKFFEKYAYYLKGGILEDSQAGQSKYKKELTDLLRFTSLTSGDDLVSLESYMADMQPDQEIIYYLSANSREAAQASPFIEAYKARKLDVLILTEEIDEFVMNAMEKVGDKKTLSIDSADALSSLDKFSAADAGEHTPLSADEQSELETFFKDVLGSRCEAIKFSTLLSSSPVVVTSQMSPHLRKMMRQMMQQTGGSAKDVMSDMPANLEINPAHETIKTLYAIRESHESLAGLAAEAIYDNACLAAGLLDEPKLITNRLHKLVESLVFTAAGKPLDLPPLVKKVKPTGVDVDNTEFEDVPEVETIQDPRLNKETPKND